METFKQGLFLGIFAVYMLSDSTAPGCTGRRRTGMVAVSGSPFRLSGRRSLSAADPQSGCAAGFRILSRCSGGTWCYIVLFCLFFSGTEPSSARTNHAFDQCGSSFTAVGGRIRYLKSVARDLNSGAAGRILLIDLDEKTRLRKNSLPLWKPNVKEFYHTGIRKRDIPGYR